MTTVGFSPCALLMNPFDVWCDVHSICVVSIALVPVLARERRPPPTTTTRTRSPAGITTARDGGGGETGGGSTAAGLIPQRGNDDRPWTGGEGTGTFSDFAKSLRELQTGELDFSSEVRVHHTKREQGGSPLEYPSVRSVSLIHFWGSSGCCLPLPPLLPSRFRTGAGCVLYVYILRAWYDTCVDS